MEKFVTNSFKETQKVAAGLAAQILRRKQTKQAVVLALSGDLGAGKTTFLQGFAQGLGIAEVVNSPTFTVMKKYRIPVSPAGRQDEKYKNFYHIDCYRLESPEEILVLGFEEIISDPENIVAVEWAEKIGNLLPKNSISIKSRHLEENKRELTIT